MNNTAPDTQKITGLHYEKGILKVSFNDNTGLFLKDQHSLKTSSTCSAKSSTSPQQPT